MCKNLMSKDDPTARDAQAAQQKSQDTAAQTAQQAIDAEAKRQANIRAGQTAIDQNFSQFGDPYFNDYKKTYLDAYNPAIDTQFAEAKSKAVAALADRGVLDSSIAGNALGKLTNTYGEARGQAANSADQAVSNLRGNIDSAKNNLYALNTGATDPSQIANQANASATSLIAQPAPTSSSLGDIFAGALSSIQAAQKANAYSPYGRTTSNTFSLAPGSSSASIIR